MAQRFTALADIPGALRGGVVAIGNFDGVHRGHREVLARAIDKAARLSVPATVLTFEPHPRSVFRPDQPVPRLTPAPIKARLFGLMGFDAVFEQHFDRSFAARSAEDFVADILVGRLGVNHVVTGYDFHFGRDRNGDPDFLIDTARRLGFGVSLVEAFVDEGDTVISSTRIRELLGQGDVVGANALLGYRHSVEAEIIHGKKLGRTLGFPTANMALAPENALRPGIYAVRLRRADGSLHDGVASFGRRPTVDAEGAPLLLETYAFGLEADLYGETCTVSLFGFLRPELKFDGLDPLMAQMREDEAEARALLSGVKPLSPFDAKVAF
ncbi:FMN adenylyltransferase /riboflavin kinase [Hoeflea marina]|uniref:Riboflavin biosynthesis protein n=1 Tax=Hoeflea marina TaxID=274592 RepID=A0A317PNH6_9HYPH|nr:bifunctional riboflavin kinase/FAD synthetase [Hoeflea marina]PWW01598.1 FMN adenylyltransferase /riboflavin kinase [Hoeflea marina]